MKTVKSYSEKAQKAYKAKKFQDAIYWFSRIIAEFGENADIFSERAVAHFHHGDLPKALQDMDRAQEMEPENAYRYASRAYIKDAMGDVSGAVADYEVAVKLDPEDAIAHNNLGLLQEKLGYHKKAKALYDFADSLVATDGQNLADTQKPQNLQAIINNEKRDKTLTDEMGRALTTKKGFSEFLNFIRNGLKK